MPRDTHTLDLEAEREDLVESRDDLVEQAAQYDTGSNEGQALQAYGARVDGYIGAVEHLLRSTDEAIVLAELTAGEKAEYLDAVEQAQEQAAQKQIGGITPGRGTRQNFHVAACLVESPWNGPDDGLQTTVQAITSEDGPHPDVVDWLEHKTTQLNSISEGNSKSFGARVRATRQQNGDE